MSLAIKALKGPLQDQILIVKSGTTLGRKGRIVLEGPKVSSLHAQIVQKEDGSWFIEDNNSKNGLRVDTERVEKATLELGTRFLIGDHEFEVVPNVPVEVDPPPPLQKNQRYWYEVLANFIETNAEETTDSPQELISLRPALVLDFQRGIQADANWVIAYGPRRIGSGSLDLPIWEPGAPDVCFEVTASADGIIFKTAHKEIVRLNGKSVDTQVLHVGDTIQILETLIEVDFVE